MLYSSPSGLTGSRLMVVARVALGKIAEIFKHDLTLEEPPEEYDSTHGVCQGPDVQSEFTVKYTLFKDCHIHVILCSDISMHVNQ